MAPNKADRARRDPRIAPAASLGIWGQIARGRNMQVGPLAGAAGDMVDGGSARNARPVRQRGRGALRPCSPSPAARAPPALAAPESSAMPSRNLASNSSSALLCCVSPLAAVRGSPSPAARTSAGARQPRPRRPRRDVLGDALQGPAAGARLVDVQKRVVGCVSAVVAVVQDRASCNERRPSPVELISRPREGFPGGTQWRL